MGSGVIRFITGSLLLLGLQGCTIHRVVTVYSDKEVSVEMDTSAEVDAQNADLKAPGDASVAQCADDACPTPADTSVVNIAGSWTGSFAVWAPATPVLTALALGQAAADPEHPVGYPHDSGGFFVDLTGDGQAESVVFTQGGAWAVFLAHEVTAQTGQLTGDTIGGVQALDPGDGGPALLLLVGKSVHAKRWNGNSFEDFTQPMGDTTAEERAALSVADIDRDGREDLVLGRYACQWPERPKVFLARGDGTWDERGQDMGVVATGAQWGVLAADVDLDGWPDLLQLHDGCSNTASTQAFYHGTGRDVQGLPQLQRVIPQALFDYPKSAMPYASPMGASAADFDGDGQLDIAIANIGTNLPMTAVSKMLGTDDLTVGRLVQNLLLRRTKTGYEDIGLQSGLKPMNPDTNHPDMTAWSPVWLDFDRDGWKDLALSNAPERDAFFNPTLRGPMKPVLLQGNGQLLVDVSEQAGFPKQHEGMKLASGDLDGDGDDDLILGGLGSAPQILRNEIKHNRHWLRLRLRGHASSARGLGAYVRLTAGTLHSLGALGTSGGYGVVSEPVIDFGLGTNTLATLEIHWPSGAIQTIANVAADQLVTVDEPVHISLTPPVLHAGQAATFTVSYDGKPLQPSDIQIQPYVNGVLQGSLATCSAQGTCSVVLTANAAISQTNFMYLRLTLAGQELGVAPRLTVLP